MSNCYNARQQLAAKEDQWDDFDYPRSDWYLGQSLRRRAKYVEAMPKKLICQDCGGSGGEIEVVCDDGTGPWYDCGWCNGTGYMTPWERGMWLRMKREQKQEMAVRDV